MYLMRNPATEISHYIAGTLKETILTVFTVSLRNLDVFTYLMTCSLYKDWNDFERHTAVALLLLPSLTHRFRTSD